MAHQAFTNFYIPGTSLRIYTKLQTIQTECELTYGEEKKVERHNSVTPLGIIDGSKLNLAYKELIKALSISELTNKEIRETLKAHLTSIIKNNEPMIIDKLETDNNSESDINADPNKSLVSIEAIFLWRRYRYSIKSIAALLSIPKEKVAEVLTQYRRNVKSLWNLNKRKTKGLRLSVGPDKLQAIKDYWDHPVKQPIKIRDIKHHVWPPSSNEKVPHDSTISRILRNELNMTY